MIRLEQAAGLLALGITGAALVAAAVTLTVTRRPGLSLKVLLDLLLAAGLVRLSGDPGWPAIATAAAIVALRRLIGLGLRTGADSWSGRPGSRPDGGRPGRRRRPAHHFLRPAWRA